MVTLEYFIVIVGVISRQKTNTLQRNKEMPRKEFNLTHTLSRVLISVIFVIGILLYLSGIGIQGILHLFNRDWITYTNEEYCYSFQFPGQWDLYTSGNEGWHGQVRPYQRAMLLEKPKPYLLGQIHMTIDQIPMENPTIENISNWSLDDSLNKNSIPSSLDSYTVDGKPASIRTFSSDPSSSTEIYIVREHDSFILRMTTRTNYHEDALATFQKIADSFVYQQCIDHN